MGSLRNPIGPLPSSIYWRRRAVALSVVALLALLIVWAVSFAGSGGRDSDGKGSDGNGPVESITPGPSSSGPAISERPGGREESGDTSSGGNTGGSNGGDSGGGDGEDGGDSGASAGAGGSGSGVPAGTSLPDCTSAAVKLTVRSVKNSYGPGEKPKFRIVAENSAGTTCKVDFGDKAAVMTITLAGDDDPLWASDDCPEQAELLLQVPAHGQTSRTVVWDRKPSEPECATPSASSAKPGTYLVEVEAAGLPTARVSFALRRD
ncbi:hypothetical protein [Streptomyces sp. KR80]|uniref:hypothetical protein n=1 Tax=Streptomyces sp. KR80 TaxID=3457426 RepID=UPI003FD14608